MASLEEKKNLNKFIEYVFGFTLNRNRTGLLHLKEFSSDENQDSFHPDILEQILFERLLISDSDIHSHLIGAAPADSHITETKCMTYLNECYHRYETVRNEVSINTESQKLVKDLIIRNICTGLKQPSLYENQNLAVQFVDIFKSYQYSVEQLTNLFDNIVSDFINTEDEPDVDDLLYSSFRPLLLEVTKQFHQSSLLLLPMHNFDILHVFSTIDRLAQVLIRLNELPTDFSHGYYYENTLFGSILSISCLPKHATQNINEFFNKPLEFTPTTLQTIEGNIWFGLDNLINNIHKIFHQILKTKNMSIRNQLLQWIGNCLEANIERGKLWTMVNNDLQSQYKNISDSMAYNLTAVLLKLSKPIVQSQEKYLKVDPTYCSYDESPQELGIHLKGLNKETCLIPLDENEIRLTPIRPLTFITECYWMTQRSIDLSIRVMIEKLPRIHRDLARLQSTYLEAMGSNRNDPSIQHMKEFLEMQTSLYMAYRTVLLHPSTLSLLSQFQLSTSVWLTQILLDTEHTDVERDSHAPLILRSVVFPLPEKMTPVLKCVPEFVIDNFSSFLLLIKNHKIDLLEQQGLPLLEPLLTFILAYMGSKSRIKNPHLRAKLAESLECLLPLHEEENSQFNPNLFGHTNRQKLFDEHPHREFIVKSILDIFVGIEMTGESVQFEQKFNYRRPMYSIMKFLWGLPEHRQNFVHLAKYAEDNMNSDQPPLFLRFINLLMNDAVFLLDEALSNMAQIRTMQSARENGEWASLPQREQEQNQSLLHHTGMIARFDNILGNETIYTLEYLSSEITSIFCHSTMVDRITAMLNYFLYHLVGPKKKNFKVKDKQEFKFTPATTVLNICKMYIHLGTSDSFCAAVSRDGRSYSPQLFSLAEEVLTRIGGGYLIEGLRKVAERVAQLGAQQKSDEELLSEAPDEYLDPIMNTLMKEPVILPSSRQTVDKSTIARHLLSDQSDPFNRSPLTIDQVIPNDKLQVEIENWIQECRRKSEKVSSNETGSSNSIEEVSNESIAD